MKQILKLSLATSMILAGLSSSVSAKDLSEAIKGVDVSGSVVYRYNDYDADDINGKDASKDQGGKDETKNYYKAVLNIKSPINEDMALNVSVAANNNFSGWDTSTKSDENVAVELTKVNFAYTGISHTTAILGKQGLATPWTIASDSDGNEQTGTGALALVNVEPVTLAVAYFNQTNLNTGDTEDYFDGTEDIATIGVMANAGPVALDAWYLTMIDQFDAYTLGAKYGFKFKDGKANFEANYSNLEFDDDFKNITEVDKKNSMWWLGAKVKYSIWGAALAYGQTDKDGGLVSLDSDTKKTSMKGWNTTIFGIKDADYIKSNINIQAMKQLNIALNYNCLDAKDDSKDSSEVFAQFTWKPSKNFYTYIRYGQLTKSDKTNNNADVDSTVGRLQIQYSF